MNSGGNISDDIGSRVLVSESSAKSIIKDGGLTVPRGAVVSTPTEAASVAESLGGPVVVKAQVPSGKRGVVGGVAFADDPSSAAKAAKNLLGSQIHGFLVDRILVEEEFLVEVEFFASIINEPREQAPLLLFSSHGGMEVEELHAEGSRRVLRKRLEPPFLPSEDDLFAWLAPENLKSSERLLLSRTLATLCQIFATRDAELLEVNPLAVTAGGDLVALDCKLSIDDSALFRQVEQVAEISSHGTEIERRASSEGFNFVELDGDVGLLANGAGLTMATMDTINHFGGRPANFLEIGGDAYSRAEVALSLVLGIPGIRSLLINLCGAFARTDVIIEGLVRALRAVDTDLPIAFCVRGTGEERANAILRNELGVEPYSQMDDAVIAAVKAAQ